MVTSISSSAKHCMTPLQWTTSLKQILRKWMPRPHDVYQTQKNFPLIWFTWMPITKSFLQCQIH